MESREEIPRISLTNFQEWADLRNAYREAVLGQAQARIRQSGAQGERDAIMARVNQFIDQSLQAAQLNLRVNGQNFETLDQDGREMEAFDEALDRRIWSLADMRLQWYKRIAETRRTVPQELQTTVASLFEQHAELDATELPPIPVDDDDEMNIDDDDNPAQKARIEETLLQVTALAGEVDQTTAQQYERAQRVKLAEAEIKSLLS